MAGTEIRRRCAGRLGGVGGTRQQTAASLCQSSSSVSDDQQTSRKPCNRGLPSAGIESPIYGLDHTHSTTETAPYLREEAKARETAGLPADRRFAAREHAGSALGGHQTAGDGRAISFALYPVWAWSITT